MNTKMRRLEPTNLLDRELRAVRFMRIAMKSYYEKLLRITPSVFTKTPRSSLIFPTKSRICFGN